MCSNSVHWVPISKIKSGKPIFGWESLLSQQEIQQLDPSDSDASPTARVFGMGAETVPAGSHRGPSRWFPMPACFKSLWTSARSFCVYFWRGIVYSTVHTVMALCWAALSSLAWWEMTFPLSSSSQYLGFGLYIQLQRDFAFARGNICLVIIIVASKFAVKWKSKIVS